MEDSKGKKVFRIIGKIIYIVIGLFLLFEVVIGFLNMEKLNNDEEPIWYFSSKEEKTQSKSEITYNLGLYKIVKTRESNEKRIVLKPFFLK